MTCESLFSLELVFLKILLVVGGQREFVKEPKEGNNSSLCSLRERERERSEEGKKEREKGKTTELENRERESALRERERERRRERILISQSRRRIDWSRPLLSGFYILSQQHQRSA